MIHDTGPTTLGCANITPVIDVVFVYAVKLFHPTTWASEENACTWLRDALPAALPPVRIISYGYDSPACLFNGEAPRLPVDTRAHAHKLLDILNCKRTKTDEARRPLIFIAHSLGGIVTMQALIMAKQKSRRAVFDPCLGVVLLGTSYSPPFRPKSSLRGCWRTIYDTGCDTGLLLCQLGCVRVMANYQPTGSSRITDKGGAFGDMSSSVLSLCGQLDKRWSTRSFLRLIISYCKTVLEGGLDPSPTLFVFSVLGYFFSFMVSYNSHERYPYQTHFLVVGFALGVATSAYMQIQHMSLNVLTTAMPLCMTAALFSSAVLDSIWGISHQADAEAAFSLVQAWGANAKIPSDPINGSDQ